MQRLLFLSFIILFFSACDQELHRQREIIFGMENAVKKNTSDPFLRPLLGNYVNYCKTFEGDEMCPIYLYRSAVIYYRVSNFPEAAANLERIMREYPETEIMEDCHLLLAQLYAGRANDKNRAEELYKSYLEKYPTGKGKIAAEYFFRPAEEKIQDHIDAQLKEIENLPRGASPSEGQWSQLMFTYANFVNSNPESPLTPAYCLQGARIANRLGHSMIAIQFLDKIYNDYPDFSDYPQALLMLAVEYDTNITLYLRKGKVLTSPLTQNITHVSLAKQDLVAKGGELYKEILQRFPEHEVAVSAKSGLKNLGKKTSEVVEEFVRVQDSIQLAKKNALGS